MANNSYKISLTSPAVVAWSMTGCGKLANTQVNAPGAVWDPQTGNIAIWYGGNTVYEYNPAARIPARPRLMRVVHQRLLLTMGMVSSRKALMDAGGSFRSWACSSSSTITRRMCMPCEQNLQSNRIGTSAHTLPECWSRKDSIQQEHSHRHHLQPVVSTTRQAAPVGLPSSASIRTPLYSCREGLAPAGTFPPRVTPTLRGISSNPSVVHHPAHQVGKLGSWLRTRRSIINTPFEWIQDGYRTGTPVA